MDRNCFINILLFSSTAFLSWAYSLWFLLLPVAFHLVNDLLHWAVGWSIFDTDIMVKRAYGAAHAFLIDQTGAGLDLGFNFYEGDLTRKREDAQKAKWDYMLKQLQLQAGHTLIDIGCGYGDWIRYARSKGIHVKGVNLTKEQVNEAKKRYDLDVLNVNWKQILKDPSLQKELYGKFDAVTFMDTIEHYVPATKRHDIAYQKKVYSDMFYLASQLLKPNSNVGRVFFSCLHQIRNKWTLLERISIWIMNRSLSGFYPIGDHGLTQYSTPYFKEIGRVDRTEDYRLTAVLEKEHFQTNRNVPWKLTTFLKGIKWFIIHPYFFHCLIGLPLDHWMRTYGTDRNEKRYDPEKRSKVSIIRLWMVTLERLKEKKFQVSD